MPSSTNYVVTSEPSSTQCVAEASSARTTVMTARPGGKGTGIPDLDYLAVHVLDASLFESQRHSREIGPTMEAETWPKSSSVFPRRLIIYRGCAEGGVGGDAWTTSKEEALRYCLQAPPIEPGVQVLVTAEIGVDDVLSVYPHGKHAINLLVGRDPEIVRTQVVVLQYDPSGNRCAAISIDSRSRNDSRDVFAPEAAVRKRSRR